MRWKLGIPSLQIFENDKHWVLELRSAHWTRYSEIGILFVPRPHFKTFSVHTLFTSFACRVALSIHLLVADGTHWIVLQRRKLINLMRVVGAQCLFELMLFYRLPSLFCILELNQTFQFRIQIGSLIVSFLPCQMIGLFAGTLNFFSRTYNVWMQWSFCTIPHEHMIVEPIVTLIFGEIPWICYHYRPWKQKKWVQSHARGKVCTS